MGLLALVFMTGQVCKKCKKRDIAGAVMNYLTPTVSLF
jgi:hypothetical protein